MSAILKINVFILFLFAALAQSVAQDMIITKNEDTIQCKIQRLENEFVFYSPSDSLKSEKAIGRFRVKEIYYAGQKIELAQKFEPQKYIMFKEPEWRIDAGAAWSYFLEVPFDNIGSDYRRFFRNLRSGRMYYLEVGKYLYGSWGAGGEIQYGSYRNSEDGLNVLDTNLVLKGVGLISEDVHIIYIQPKAIYSIYSSTWDLSVGMGINLTHLRRDITLLEDTYEYRGEAIGLGLSTAIDRKLSSSLAVGLRVSLGISFLSEIRLNGEILQLEEENYFSASQVALGFGIKYLL